MIYGMRETNQNISKKSLLNLPIPSLHPPREIAVYTYRAYREGEKYLRLLESYDLVSDSNSGIVDILDNTWRRVNRDKIYKIFKYDIWLAKNFSSSYLNTLSDYIAIGDISVKRTKSITLASMSSKKSDLIKMLDLLRYSYGSRSVLDPSYIYVPQMSSLHIANSKYENFIDDIEMMGKNFGKFMHGIDNAVITWYKMDKYATTIEKGLPWWNK